MPLIMDCYTQTNRVSPTSIFTLSVEETSDYYQRLSDFGYQKEGLLAATAKLDCFGTLSAALFIQLPSVIWWYK